MNWHVIEQLLIGGTYTLLVVCLIGIIFAAAYDSVRISQRKSLPRVVRNQPHITVIVYVTDSTTLEQSLRSIAHNKYRHFDVVVVDDRSRGASYQQTRLLKGAFKMHCTVYRRRKAAPLATVLTAAYRKSLRGQLVLVLDSAMCISDTFLYTCAQEYTAFPAESIQCKVVPGQRVSFLSMISGAERKGSDLRQKALSLIGVASGTRHTMGALYQRQAFLNDRPRLWASFRGNLSIQEVRPPSIRPTRLSSPLSVGGALSVLVCVTVFLCIAFIAEDGTLLLTSWAVVTLWLLAAIWLDEAETGKAKLTATFTLPSLYFFMYVTGIMQFVFLQVRTIFNRG